MAQSFSERLRKMRICLAAHIPSPLQFGKDAFHRVPDLRGKMGTRWNASLPVFLVFAACERFGLLQCTGFVSYFFAALFASRPFSWASQIGCGSRALRTEAFVCILALFCFVVSSHAFA